MKATSEKRWLAAQKAESLFWQNVVSSQWHVLWELTEHSQYVVPHMLKVIKEKSHLRAIEIGVGALGIGLLSVYLAPKCSEIVGVEPLPCLDIKLEDKALETYAKALQSRVNVLREKGEKLPVQDKSFDLACCINVLDHTHDPYRIIQEAHRILKVEGVFVLGVHTRSRLVRIKWRLQRLLGIETERQKKHPHTFNWTDLNSYLEKRFDICWRSQPSLIERSVGLAVFSTWILKKR